MKIIFDRNDGVATAELVKEIWACAKEYPDAARIVLCRSTLVQRLVKSELYHQSPNNRLPENTQIITVEYLREMIRNGENITDGNGYIYVPDVDAVLDMLLLPIGVCENLVVTC